uniref:FAE domain-containing protein n=1 Tax=Nelumbo nucifera TaxID=4432 RepID=A0A822ZNJ3_NELNU|nr:TPA_asm: hypothetical protein HUJ06_003305 [Nelumbo nucifera]
MEGVGAQATENGGVGEGSGIQAWQSRRLPNFLQSVNVKYVKLGYHYLMKYLLENNLVSVAICSALLVLGATVYFMMRPRPMYLVDFACYLLPPNLRVNFKDFMEHSRLTGDFDESSLEFQCKILEHSGLGEETHVPNAMRYIPPQSVMANAREESKQVMFGALDNLFSNISMKPKDIGILVVNCSLFNPTPSLSAMIINKYKLRGNIRSFNLGGMGCRQERSPSTWPRAFSRFTTTLMSSSSALRTSPRIGTSGTRNHHPEEDEIGRDRI